MLLEKYKSEIASILSRYPVKRSALLPLLYLAQEEEGYVTEAAMTEIAGILKRTPPQVHKRQEQQVSRERHQRDRQSQRIDVHHACPSASTAALSAAAISTVICNAF